jgi:hypothetical protein
MNLPHSSLDCFPLLPNESDIWDSVDKPTQEKVLDCLSLLLLQHRQQTPRNPAEEEPLTKGHST